MAWLLQNWFWVLIAIIFVGVHLVGHGGHGGHGHGGHANEKVDEGDDPLHASHRDEQVSKSHDHQHKGGRSC
jgi:hypothetical protein